MTALKIARLMMVLSTAVVVAFVSMTALPGHALAQDAEIVTGSDQDRIAELLRGDGASVESEVVGGFDSFYIQDDGLIYQILFLRCDPGPCRMVQLRTRFVDGALTASQANEWNVLTSFARALISPEGIPELRMDIMMGAGVPEDVFLENLANWYALIPLYAQFISTGTNPFLQQSQ